MVLVWRIDANSQAGLVFLAFDGKHGKDAAKIFFVYKNVSMKVKTEEDKARELLCYLQEEVFDYYYETYS